jgi:ferric-dicitrate binding protein FerR (iron transport regulator)
MQSDVHDIDVLIVRKLTGQISEDEARWLQRRIESDEQVRTTYEEASKIWHTSAKIPRSGVLTSDERYQNIAVRITEDGSAKSFHKWWRYAAVTVGLLLMATAYLIFKPSDIVTHRVAQGESRTYILPDGSRVNVNGGSSITFVATDFLKRRDITLSGEAFFEVKKSKATFTVFTERAKTEVLGTSFGVKSTPHQTVVGCVSGKVRVRDAGDEFVELTKGFGVTVATELSPVYTINEAALLDWTTLQFKDTMLSEVFRNLEERFSTRVVYQDSLSDVTFSGKFTRPSLYPVLETICLSAGLTYHIAPDSSIWVQKK